MQTLKFEPVKEDIKMVNKIVMIATCAMIIATSSAQAETVTVKGINWKMTPEQVFNRALELAKKMHGDNGSCISISGGERRELSVFPGTSYDCGRKRSASESELVVVDFSYFGPNAFGVFGKGATYLFKCSLLNSCKMQPEQFAQYVVNNLPIKRLKGVSENLWNGVAQDGEIVTVYSTHVYINKGSFGTGGPSLK